MFVGLRLFFKPVFTGFIIIFLMTTAFLGSKCVSICQNPQLLLE
ncbi:hypothetical protein Ssal_00623 [Streptococcus salivarius 57.I]|nr:hypothetical protein Ssal_00623 [Streptococcus salivarius 57.I]